MRLIELTDFNGTGKKEYVVAEHVTHWFFHEQKQYDEVEKEVDHKVGWKTVKKTIVEYVTKPSKFGSRLFLVNGECTYVAESPEQIAKLMSGPKYRMKPKGDNNG